MIPGSTFSFWGAGGTLVPEPQKANTHIKTKLVCMFALNCGEGPCSHSILRPPCPYGRAPHSSTYPDTVLQQLVGDRILGVCALKRHMYGAHFQTHQFSPNAWLNHTTSFLCISLGCVIHQKWPEQATTPLYPPPEDPSFVVPWNTVPPNSSMTTNMRIKSIVAFVHTPR